MASVVEICNRALSNIGNSRSINSLTEASKEAEDVRCTLRPAVMLCFLILTGTLLPNAWRLQIQAIHRLTGNMRISTRPIVCALLKLCFCGVRNPTAAMRVQYEVGADTNGTGKLICTDQPQAWLKYVSRVTDVNMFDAILWRRWRRLAAAINMALTGNADLGTFALNMYNRVILSAGSHSQNESQEPQPPVDEFTIARLS